jgi:hypothetical protein
MHTMEEHLKNASSQYDDWRKNLTVLAIGALTVLVAMMPENPPAFPSNYFLAVCWVLLSLCIPCSLAASFISIIESKKMVYAIIDLQQAPNSQGKIPGSKDTIKLHRLHKIFLWAQVAAITTFCLSFISLAIYACMSIL